VDAQNGCLCLGGNKAESVFTGNQSAEAANLANEWPSFDGVSPNGRALDGGGCWLESEHQGAGDSHGDDRKNYNYRKAALAFAFDVWPGDIHDLSYALGEPIVL
jgi:hypothetical protein